LRSRALATAKLLHSGLDHVLEFVLVGGWPGGGAGRAQIVVSGQEVYVDKPIERRESVEVLLEQDESDS